MSTANKSATCPCCGEPRTDLLGRLPDAMQFAGKQTAEPIPGGALYRCGNCRLKFRHPIQSPATYNELYDHGEANIWTGDVLRLDWDLIVQYLDEDAENKRSILDFGCNTGGLLARLGDGFEKFGIEINQAAAAAATEHGIKVWPSIDALPVGQQFDVIVAVDVVEHVPDPRQVIEQLADLLAPDGQLILTTGDAENVWWNRFGANWWYCFHPEHISFISRAWLSYLEANSSLITVDCKQFRYRRMGVIMQSMHALFMMLYGFLPSLYLGLRNAVRRLLSRPDVASVLGNGVSADHLFVVLRKDQHGQ